jgi:PAS domain-containing protein
MPDLGGPWSWLVDHWPPWATTLLLVAGAATLLLVKALPVLSAALKDRRAARRDDLRESAEARAQLLIDLQAALDRAEQYRGRLEAAEEAGRAATVAERACRAEVAALAERLSHVEAALPLALTAARIQDWQSLGEVLDRAADPWVISSPAEEGRVLWVNRAFAAALGMEAAAIVAAGWRALIHPEDLAETERAEAGAWDGGVAVVNRYRHAAGRWVSLRWYAPRYEGGVTLALVRVVG